MVGRRICGGEYSHGNHGIGQLLRFEIPIVTAFLLGHSFVVSWRMSVSHDFSRVSIFVFFFHVVSLYKKASKAVFFLLVDLVAISRCFNYLVL